MTAVNKEELRRLAEAAMNPMYIGDRETQSQERIRARSAFDAMARPSAVLSLLDELDNCRLSWGLLNAQRDQLRAEVESLRAQLKACHPFRPAQEPKTPVFARGCIVCGDLNAHGGLQCPKIRPECTAQRLSDE